MAKIVVLITGLFLMLGYQNCSNNMGFNADGVVVAKTDAGGIGTDPINTDPINTGDGSPVGSNPPPPSASPPPSSSRPPGTMPPVAHHPSDDDDDDHDGHHGDDGCDGHDNDGDISHDDDSSGPRSYVCVLEGPGSSVKLGLIKGELTGKNATPDDICMSEHACEDIVSQAFNVKGAEKRGFCPNKNKHVVEMSDKQIESAIANAKLERILSGN